MQLKLVTVTGIKAPPSPPPPGLQHPPFPRHRVPAAKRRGSGGLPGVAARQVPPGAAGPRSRAGVPLLGLTCSRGEGSEVRTGRGCLCQCQCRCQRPGSPRPRRPVGGDPCAAPAAPGRLPERSAALCRPRSPQGPCPGLWDAATRGGVVV